MPGPHRRTSHVLDAHSGEPSEPDTTTGAPAPLTIYDVSICDRHPVTQAEIDLMAAEFLILSRFWTDVELLV